MWLQYDFRDNDSGEVRVYPGKLQVSESFCIVPVTEATTVADLINEALEKFGLQNFNCDDFRCSEILLDQGGTFQVYPTWCLQFSRIFFKIPFFARKM